MTNRVSGEMIGMDTYRITKNTIDYKPDMDWSETMLPQVIKILEEQLNQKIERASMNDDFNEATDLRSNDGKRICVRVRRKDRTFRDLTIRVEKGNVKTELSKIREGYGDIYFYGWSDNYNLNEWIIVDLNKMRECGLIHEKRYARMNKDGYTGFVYYPASELRNHKLLISELLA